MQLPPVEVLRGIQLLFGLQLIVVAILHFTIPSKPTRHPLAWLCLLFGLWFFKRVFFVEDSNSLLQFVLIGPGKPIYAGVLLWWYYRTLYQQVRWTKYWPYLLLPSLYYLAIVLTRFVWQEELFAYRFGLSVFFSLTVFIIYLIYFILTKKEVDRPLKRRLIPRAYRRIKLLFYSIYFFLLQVPLWDLWANLLQAQLLPGLAQQVLENGYNNGARYGLGIIYGYLHLLAYFLFLYALIEIPQFKRLFLPNTTLQPSQSTDEQLRIAALLNRFLYEQKGFKDHDLTLARCAQKLELAQKTISDHLQKHHQVNFRALINRLRIEECKQLMQSDLSTQYSLVGLGRESGFKSKATFFRVFKELEGCTPNEYRKTITNQSQ